MPKGIFGEKLTKWDWLEFASVAAFITTTGFLVYIVTNNEAAATAVAMWHMLDGTTTKAVRWWRKRRIKVWRGIHSFEDHVLDKLLADPEFDPTKVIKQALKAYLEHTPLDELSSYPAIMKYVKKDTDHVQP